METIWQIKTLFSVVLCVIWSAVGSTVAGQTVDEIKETSETRYGSHVDSEGWVHFVVFAPEATQVDVLLYDAADAKMPMHEVAMKKNGSDWRVRVWGKGVGHGLPYMYRAKGPRDVSLADQYGLMFNEVFPLNDPYAYDTQDVTFSRVFSSQPHVDATLASQGRR